MTERKKESKQETKKIIQEVALDLFSRHGFRAVSIRDICKEVGIKESTIYYHYKNKQDILDTILEQIDILIQSMEDTFSNALATVNQIKKEEFCEVAANYLNQYLLMPYVHKIISMLTIERLSDSKANCLYKKLLFELPTKHQENIFEKMYQRGLIKNKNFKNLAYDYNAIIYYAYQKYCFGEKSEEHYNLCMEEMTLNMKCLFERMEPV